MLKVGVLRSNHFSLPRVHLSTSLSFKDHHIYPHLPYYSIRQYFFHCHPVPILPISSIPVPIPPPFLPRLFTFTSFFLVKLLNRFLVFNWRASIFYRLYHYCFSVFFALNKALVRIEKYYSSRITLMKSSSRF